MTTAIQPTNMILGEYGEIETFAKRIKQMMRGGEKLSVNDAMSLAQFSKVTGLNPFIGECWWIPGSGAMVGIAGARRLEQEQARQTGSSSSPNISVCSAEEAGATEAELKDVIAAFRCEINDSHASWEYMKMFTETLDSLRAAGVGDPVPVAREICGPRPSWVGYGYSKKSEPSRMNKVQLARKRSEADALKKRIVIPFGAEIAESEVAPDYVDATAEEPKAKRSIDQNLKELGFSDHEKHHEIGLGNVEKDFPGEVTPLIINRAEDVNQDTAQPEQAIELIDPMGDWAVKYAAAEWNIGTSEAAKAIASKKIGKRIAKADFIEIVKG